MGLMHTHRPLQQYNRAPGHHAQSFLQVPTTPTQTPSQPQEPARSPMPAWPDPVTNEESQNDVELANL